MIKEDIAKLEKSQLMFYFLIARDNLISVKKALFQRPEEENLKIIYQEESQNYENLLAEIYRRMKKWVKV